MVRYCGGYESSGRVGEEMINSRDPADLIPRVAAKCAAFVSACKAQGVDVIITSTYRDKESQDALYAQGRTKPGPRVTNAFIVTGKQIGRAHV